MKRTSILFLLKRNETYGFTHYCRRSSGLWNSVNFIADFLWKNGCNVAIEEAIDSNCIDRLVTLHKPKVVILEALWNTPEKLKELKRLHPHIIWYCRIHSHMPFLALEGMSMGWLREYTKLGVGIMANSKPMHDALSAIVPAHLLSYFPNVYTPKKLHRFSHNHSHLHIGCFGAVRPLKNHLLQAMAAIKFAKEKGKFLKFYINGSRVETGGNPVLKNLRQLFEDSEYGKLIEIDWLEHEKFVDFCQYMDIGMQVSLTETFSIVSADYVTAEVPIVVSKEIDWASRFCKAKDDDVNDIVRVLHRVYKNKCLVKRNKKLLAKASRKAENIWYEFTKNFNTTLTGEKK